MINFSPFNERYEDFMGRSWGHIEVVRSLYSANPIDGLLLQKERNRFNKLHKGSE